MHLLQKDLHFPRLLLEGRDLIGTPEKILRELGHLLIKISFGRGCSSKVINVYHATLFL